MDRAKDRGRKAGRRHLACAPSTGYEFHLAPGPRKDIGRMAEQLSACGTIRWKGQVDSGIDGTSAKRRTQDGRQPAHEWRPATEGPSDAGLPRICGENIDAVH